GATTVGIVPHTHWDREWYAPFQRFRLRLVGLLDTLLELLEDDDSYHRFLLDGQTAVIDDYLEVRPDSEPIIRRLVAEGRLTIGPWMILMDEFMVSGETVVRNLQMGLRRAAELGGAMPVGYLPDMFGHVAQMPQILRAAGLEHAVVWRGVPGAIDRTGFWWEAPDGSRVRAEYLYGSYSNGRDLPDHADGLVARANGYSRELGDFRLAGGDLLLMNGSDHLLPQPGLGSVVAAANAGQRELRFEVTSLPEYLGRQPVEGLPTWTGELRSGARADVLMGVASNRVDVHRAAAAAERAVERVAEPMAALFRPSTDFPHALLDLAWQALVLNSAHDSSCACSADEVVDQVIVRYAEARQIGEGVADGAVASLAASVAAPAGHVVVANPSQADRGGLIELTVPGGDAVHLVADDGTPVATQAVTAHTSEVFSTTVVGRKVAWVIEMMRGPEIAGTQIGRIDHRVHPDGSHEYHFVGVDPGEPAVDLEAVRSELRELGEQDTTFRLRVTRASEQVVIAIADSVPGFGWRTFAVTPGSVPETGLGSASLGTLPVELARLDETAALGNGLVRVELDAPGRGYSVEADGVRVDGLGRLVDGGDGGDTYNYSPPHADRLVDAPIRTSWTVDGIGPVRGRLVLDQTYEWPRNAIGDERSCSHRNEQTIEVTVRTILELRAGERFVRVRTQFENPSRDHRLRAHFPLPTLVTGSDAECAFGVVHRGLEAEGGPHEAGLPTFVSRRFVDASDGRTGLAILHDGILEYELVDDGRELALTLLRATGYLSRAEPSLRPNPAGPLDELRGPQLVGAIVADYAVLPHRGDWQAAELYARAQEFLVPLSTETVPATSSAELAVSGRGLRVEGAVVSAVTRTGAELTLRVFNPAPAPANLTVELDGVPARGTVVDLRDHEVDAFVGQRDLRAGEIVTLRLH
ncbi:MAG: glycoside hydrolase family 38 N-terminal domain-containing protein, partial [Acidimicrobiia bacterium]